METQIKEIYELIKQNKVKFKYGFLKARKPPMAIAIIDEKNKLTIETTNSYLMNTFIGYSKIGNLYIAQKPFIKNGEVSIKYFIFNTSLDFTVNSNLNISTLKILTILLKWQVGSLYNKDKLLYMLEYLKVPNEFKKCKKPLYRSLNLSPTAVRKLKKNLPIRLEDRKFSSWSENKDSLKNLINVGSAVLMYSPVEKEILINIQLFYESLGFEDPMYKEEKEILLVNSPRMLQVFPDQVELKN